MSAFAIAFDVETLEQALELDTRLGPGPEFAKVGLQLFTGAGPDAVRALKERGRKVFLDLKLHDIPNTVRGAAAAAGALGADLLTVHATGGEEMVRAAVEGAGQGTRIVAVTLLTSLDPNKLPPGFEKPFDLDARLADLLALAERAGALGIVCSAADLEGLHRQRVGRPFFSVTPGIRPMGADTQDQKRVTTITQAVKLGANLLVLGRAVTGAPDPHEALERARAERDVALLALQG
jgi:orotidine-5'-phosphate decarboxylase